VLGEFLGQHAGFWQLRFAVAREGGDSHSAAALEQLLPKARDLVERLGA
jgi:hypothetical protein